MAGKFVDGLTFGAGFAISFLAISWLGTTLLALSVFDRRSEGTPSVASPHFKTPATPENQGPQFHEMSIEDQIKTASVIALARFEAAPDGKQRAIIKEFLKKDPGVTIHYGIGDEYQRGGFYPSEKAIHGDGIVIFFVDSPASMRMSMSYSGDRISGLGDIPMQLFRDKCKAGT